MTDSSHSALDKATATGLTIGVEEEFLLVDEISGRTAPRAAAVLAKASTAPPCAEGAAVHSELLSIQIEATTGVCVTLEGLRAQLCGARAGLARAAQAERTVLISSGTPILADTVPSTAGPTTAATLITAGERYDHIARAYAGVVADYQVCGCHVHVGVPDRDTAVAVLNHVARWLPTLLAMSGNSPFYQGHDTGYASWRMVQQTRFPGSGLSPWFSSAADYDEQVARLVECGALIDQRMTFWVARPSPQLPTVEFRVADAASTVDEAVLQAALSRALVRTALGELAAGREACALRAQVASAALWCAARHGLNGPGVDLLAERRVPALDLLHELVSWVSCALEEVGDLGPVRDSVAELVKHGIGAEHQRRAAVAGLHAVVGMLGTRTTRGL
ncbi:MAG: glutamate--cysteine ligase [Actinomycetota bacterium]|nr:glutamate--cysteine ligase [Actinomycetota bacterium]